MKTKFKPKANRQTFIAQAGCGRSLFVAAFLTSLSVASAQTTLIYDSFSFSGNLNGHTPDTTVGGASWVAPATGTRPTAGGSTLSVPVAQTQVDSIFLGANYFASNPGIYTLSYSLAFPVNASPQAGWVALGFASNPLVTGTMSTSTSSSGLPNGGMPFLLLRDNGALRVYPGSATTGGTSPAQIIDLAAGAYPDGSSYTISLTLDTTALNWNLNAYVGATQLDLNGASAGDTYTYASNPSTIGYVGISASPGTTSPIAIVDDFRLTVTTVPEPGTYGLLLAGGLIFGGIGRTKLFRSA